MAVQVSRARMLPHPPQSYAKDEQDAAWYEHQERMRPSYISQPAFQYQQQVHYGPVTGASIAAAAPPLSPSARWSAPAAPVKTGTAAQYKQRTGPPQQQQYYFPAEVQPFPSAANVAQPSFVNGASRPRPPQLQSAPSRFHLNGQTPFALSSDEEDRRMGAAHGSAFMHKGFFDIMSLVNSQAVSSRIDSQPNGGGLKATFSKATGRLRKISMPGRQNQGSPEDDFFSSASPAIYKAPSPLAPVSTNKLNAGTSIPASTSAGGGIRAQKKRISVDMVGAPKIGTFLHAAHASDAEQAEEILRRWSRDGVGKIADPAWINRCKEALRVQYERNQAEAIAQVQAALHQDSMISNNPRALQIMNGAPSPSLTASNFTMSTATSTGTGATAGHSGAAQGNPFQGIAEERLEKSSRPVTPRRNLPATPPVASRPGMMPRTNTQGTILVAASPEAAAPEGTKTPDYMHYQPNPQAALANSVEPESPTKRASKVIDGLPGTAGGIGALFDRPVSMVVRDDPVVHGGVLNLAGELMASPLAAHAGAALRPSLTTVEKSVAAKIFFENLYYGILKKPRDRDTRKAGLERELAGLRIPESAKDDIRAAWTANETEYLRDIRARVNVNSFTRLKTIGHGAFGVVALVREQGTGQLFAMKQLRKADMLRKGQEGHVRAERDLMTSASASANAKWIVKLVYSFQDVDHLYLIMEFMGGGDLLNLLIEKDIFAEDFARFYVAEMILAIHEAHQLGYIHRDIKPDNFLFTSQGHIKLADFGLCQSFHWAHDGAYYDQQRKQLLKKHGIDLEDSGATRAKRGIAASLRQQQAPQKGGYLDEGELNNIMSDRNEDGTPLTHVLTWRDKNKRKIAYSVVGTNNYMAPEVLRGLGYDQSCDWWSLGVIVFEMLYGYPPFVSKSRHLTRQKILNWKQTLRFPPKPKVSREAQDFIAKLICEKDDRLGSMNNASVSRPNSLLQGSRQPSGFAASGTDTPRANSAGLVDGVEDLMAHPWFRGVDWGRLHASKAPFRPALSHAADTKHFEDDIDDEPLPAPGAAEAAKDGQPVPVEQPRDPMLRDKAHGQHLLEMRKQLAFVGYTFKSPKDFDPKAQLTESKIVRAEQGQHDARAHARLPTEGGSHLRSMSM